MEEQGMTGQVTEMGALSRVMGVLFAPAKAFESIARKPGWDWLVPLALLVAVTLVGSILVGPKLDVESAVKQQMKAIGSNPNIDEARRADIESRVRGQMKFFTTGMGRWIAPCFLLIPIFLVPLIYHGIAAAFGKKTTYVAVLAGYAYVQMTQVLKGVVTLIVCIPKSSIDIMDAQLDKLVMSNVGAFLDPEKVGMPLVVFTSNLDLFGLWALFLAILALSKTTRFTPRAAALTAGGLWLVWAVIKTGLAAIQAAFSG